MRKISLIAVSALMLIGTQAYAGDMAKLNLSKEQKLQIKKINQKYFNKQEHIEKKQAFLKERKAFFDSRFFDENRARALLKEKEKMREDAQIKKWHRQYDVYQILNPQQKEKWLKKQYHRHGKKTYGKHSKSHFYN